LHDRLTSLLDRRQILAMRAGINENLPAFCFTGIMEKFRLHIAYKSCIKSDAFFLSDCF